MWRGVSQDGYGWLYLGVYFFAMMVSFVNLHLGMEKNTTKTGPGADFSCGFQVGSILGDGEEDHVTNGKGIQRYSQ